MSDNAIRRIQVGDLRKMSDREGLILQGCGGDPQEWLEGINEMLTDAGILRNGSRFERASLFEYDGHTNMLFDFEGVDLDVGKLAMWRLTTYGTIGGTWLSDYVPNRLGIKTGYEQNGLPVGCLKYAFKNCLKECGIEPYPKKVQTKPPQRKESNHER